MVLAEDSPTAGEHVLFHLAGCGIFTHRRQAAGEVRRRKNGVGVVLAEDSPTAGEHVLFHLAGRGIRTHRPQAVCEVRRCVEGVGVVLAEAGRPPVVDLSAQMGCGAAVAAGPQRPTQAQHQATTGGVGVGEHACGQHMRIQHGVPRPAPRILRIIRVRGGEQGVHRGPEPCPILGRGVVA